MFNVILSPLRDAIPTPSAGGTLAQVVFVNSNEKHVKKVVRKN